MILTVENAGFGFDLPVRVAGCGRVQRLGDELIHFTDAQVNYTRAQTVNTAVDIHSSFVLFVPWIIGEMAELNVALDICLNNGVLSGPCAIGPSWKVLIKRDERNKPIPVVSLLPPGLPPRIFAFTVSSELLCFWFHFSLLFVSGPCARLSIVIKYLSKMYADRVADCYCRLVSPGEYALRTGRQSASPRDDMDRDVWDRRRVINNVARHSREDT